MAEENIKANAAQYEAKGEIPPILPEGTVFEETIEESRIYHVLEGCLGTPQDHLRKYKATTIYQHTGMPYPLMVNSSFEVSRDSTRLKGGVLGISKNTRRLSSPEIEALPQNDLTAKLKDYLKDLKVRPVNS